jgi:hypothetical protein
MNKVPYVTSKKVLTMLNINNNYHYFINLPYYLRLENNVVRNNYIGLHYLIIDELSKNENLRDYFSYGYIYPKLHEDLESLINRLLLVGEDEIDEITIKDICITFMAFKVTI